MSLTLTSVNNVVTAMSDITEVLPAQPADALAALTFVLIEQAVKANVAIEDVHDGIAKAMASRNVALMATGGDHGH